VQAITNQSLIGNLLVLAGTICWSAYTVLSKLLLQRYTPLKLTTLTTIIGTPFLILASIPCLNEQDWGSVSYSGWLGLIYSSCFAVTIGYVVWYTGVSRIGSVRTALYSNLTPVISIVLARFLLHESMTPLQILGTSLVLTSLYLARRSSRKHAFDLH